MFTIKNTNRLSQKVSKQLVEDLSQEEIDKVLEQIEEIIPKKVILTFQQKILPSLEQKKVLWLLAENNRLIYNFALQERLDWWEQNKDKPKNEREKYPSYNKQQNDLPKLKEKYPRYKQSFSKTLQMTLRQLNSDFKSFFALKKNGDSNTRLPRYKGKKYFTALIYNQWGFKIDGQEIIISHFYPSKQTKTVELRFKLVNRFNLIEKKIKQVVITQNNKTLEFFLSIAYEQETPIYQDNGLYQAIDQGVMNIVAGVNNHAGKTLTIKNQRMNKYWQPKIEELMSKQAHCKKYSNRWFWYNDKLNTIYKKQANQQRDFQHKISKKIVQNTKANTIIIGDLNAKEMHKKATRNKKGDRSLRRALLGTGSISRFTRFLTYKAQMVGKKVIRISETRTTKRCCFCGKKAQRKLSERIINCDKCGIVIDRDVNASVNIMQRFLAILFLSHERPLVGQQFLIKFRKLFFSDKQLWNMPIS